MTLSHNFTSIKDDFDFLDSWEDKYRFVIELGKAYAALPEDLRIDALKVQGCASQVWLDLRVVQGRLRFQGASDALIVSGLIAILASLYDEQPLACARDIDALGAFGTLGLDQHLSAQRSNGLRAMIMRVQNSLHESQNTDNKT